MPPPASRASGVPASIPLRRSSRIADRIRQARSELRAEQQGEPEFDEFDADNDPDGNLPVRVSRRGQLETAGEESEVEDDRPSMFNIPLEFGFDPDPSIPTTVVVPPSPPRRRRPPRRNRSRDRKDVDDDVAYIVDKKSWIKLQEKADRVLTRHRPLATRSAIGDWRRGAIGSYWTTLTSPVGLFDTSERESFAKLLSTGSPMFSRRTQLRSLALDFMKRLTGNGGALNISTYKAFQANANIVTEPGEVGRKDINMVEIGAKKVIMPRKSPFCVWKFPLYFQITARAVTPKISDGKRAPGRRREGEGEEGKEGEEKKRRRARRRPVRGARTRSRTAPRFERNPDLKTSGVPFIRQITVPFFHSGLYVETTVTAYRKGEWKFLADKTTIKMLARRSGVVDHQDAVLRHLERKLFTEVNARVRGNQNPNPNSDDVREAWIDRVILTARFMNMRSDTKTRGEVDLDNALQNRHSVSGGCSTRTRTREYSFQWTSCDGKDVDRHKRRKVLLTNVRSSGNNCGIACLIRAQKVIHKDAALPCYSKTVRQHFSLDPSTCTSLADMCNIAEYFRLGLRVFNPSMDLLVEREVPAGDGHTAELMLMDDHYYLMNTTIDAAARKWVRKRCCACKSLYYAHKPHECKRGHLEAVARTVIERERVRAHRRGDVAGEMSVDSRAEDHEIKEVLTHVANKHHVFMAGPGGCGKTYSLRAIVKTLRGKFSPSEVLVTASTGTAARNLDIKGASTLHSSLGLGYHTSRDKVPTLVKKMSRPRREMLQNLKVIIIDEVSMIPGTLLDVVDEILRAVRDAPGSYFGGVCCVMSGDHFQLPPVSPGTHVIPFYLSSMFRETFTDGTLQTVRFTRNYRYHENEFFEVMLRIRQGVLNRHDAELLLTRVKTREEVMEQMVRKPNTVIVTSTREQTDVYNGACLIQAPGSVVVIPPAVEHEEKRPPTSDTPDPVLRLKVGCRVLCLLNRTREGISNGTLGTFVQYDEKNDVVHVMTSRGVCKLTRSKRAGVRQFPIMLAYAITIHRVQGATLSDCIIDMGGSCRNHRIFAIGQLYVALSRVRSLQSLVLTNVAGPHLSPYQNLRNSLRVGKSSCVFERSLSTGHLDVSQLVSLAAKCMDEEGFDDRICIRRKESASHSKRLRQRKRIVYDFETSADPASSLHVPYCVSYREVLDINLPSVDHFILRVPDQYVAEVKTGKLPTPALQALAVNVSSPTAHRTLKRTYWSRDVLVDFTTAVINAMVKDADKFLKFYRGCMSHPNANPKKRRIQQAVLAKLRRPIWLVGFNQVRFDLHFLLSEIFNRGLDNRFAASFIGAGSASCSTVKQLVIVDTFACRVVLKTHDLVQVFPGSLAGLSKDFCGESLKGVFPHFAMSRRGMSCLYARDIDLDQRDWTEAHWSPACAKYGPARKFPIFDTLLTYCDTDVAVLEKLYDSVDDIVLGCDGKTNGIAKASVLEFMTSRAFSHYVVYAKHLPAVVRHTIIDRTLIVTDIFKLCKEGYKYAKGALYAGRVYPTARHILSHDVAAICTSHELTSYFSGEDIRPVMAKAQTLKASDIKDYWVTVDFTSMYPAAMMGYSYPYGPHFFSTAEDDLIEWKMYFMLLGHYYVTNRTTPKPTLPFGAKHFIVQAVSACHPSESVPPVAGRVKGRITWDNTKQLKCLNDVDVHLLLRNEGTLDATTIGGVMYWKKSAPWLRKPIDALRSIKDEGESSGKRGLRQGGKIALNTVYGDHARSLFRNTYEMTGSLAKIWELHNVLEDVVETVITDDCVLITGTKTLEEALDAVLLHIGGYILAYSRLLYDDVVTAACPDRRAGNLISLTTAPIYSDTDSLTFHVSQLPRLINGGFIGNGSDFGRLTDDYGDKGWWSSVDNHTLALTFSKIVIGHFAGPKKYGVAGFKAPNMKWFSKVRVAGISHKQLQYNWRNTTRSSLGLEPFAEMSLVSYNNYRRSCSTDTLNVEDWNPDGATEITLVNKMKRMGLNPTGIADTDKLQYFAIFSTVINRTLFASYYTRRHTIRFDVDGRYHGLMTHAGWVGKAVGDVPQIPSAVQPVLYNRELTSRKFARDYKDYALFE